jgi:Ca2+:H+ antiporter
VQSSLIGSILSNLLLVLGMCFFAGGTRFAEQGFSTGAAQINTSLLTLSGTAVLLPAFLFYAMTAGTTLTGSSLVAAEKTASLDILKISHGAAILLLFTYGCYLYFQLRSHAYMYEDVNNPDVATSLKFGERRCPTPSASILSLSPSEAERVPILTRATPIGPGAFEAAHIAAQDDEEVPTISILACTILLAAVTALVALTSEFLVDSINGLSVKSGIGKEFIGLILLPIVGNAAEHWTAVTVSVKDKLTLSIGVAVGSSIQIALFVIPFIVSLGWAIGTPMTMFFDPFESAVLFLSVITVNYVIQDGKSNWLEGVILMVLYVVIGVCVFFYGGTEAILSC